MDSLLNGIFYCRIVMATNSATYCSMMGMDVCVLCVSVCSCLDLCASFFKSLLLQKRKLLYGGKQFLINFRLVINPINSLRNVSISLNWKKNDEAYCYFIHCRKLFWKGEKKEKLMGGFDLPDYSRDTTISRLLKGGLYDFLLSSPHHPLLDYLNFFYYY